MPVTEIATLRLTPPYRWDSSDTQAFFGTLAVEQAAWSGYPLRFFEDVHNTQVVYLITGWKSVPAHYEWIASEQNQKLLERAQGLIEVLGLVHAEVDSDVADAPIVIWTMRQLREGERFEGKEGTGIVLEEDKPGFVCSLKGSDADEDEGGIGGEGTRRMRILTLLGTA